MKILKYSTYSDIEVAVKGLEEIGKPILAELAKHEGEPESFAELEALKLIIKVVAPMDKNSAVQAGFALGIAHVKSPELMQDWYKRMSETLGTVESVD